MSVFPALGLRIIGQKRVMRAPDLFIQHEKTLHFHFDTCPGGVSAGADGGAGGGNAADQR